MYGKSIKMMISAMIITVCLASVFTGCGPKKPEDVSVPEQSAEDETAEAAQGNDVDQEQNTDLIDTAIDISSEKDMFDYLTGEWIMEDTVGGKEIGQLTINPTGGIVYERLSDGLKCEGNMFLSRFSNSLGDANRDSNKNSLTSYEFSFYDIPDGFSIQDTMYDNPGKETAGGNFYIGRCGGEDYLYLTFIANGDSFIFYEMFQDADRITEEISESDNYIVQGDWVLHRANDGQTENELPASGDFYAWAWKQADDTLWLQPMESQSFETYDEYTLRHYNAGYFEEKGDIRIGEYHLSDDTDMTMVLKKDNVRTEYPLAMYKVKTDMKGNIQSMEDVPFSYYGLYDMGDLEPEFSYDDGLTFTYNGGKYDLADYDTVSNAIMDMYRVGEWIVIETHVNPHVGQYYLLNIYTGNIERVITGAGLTWRGDDLTTAIYSAYDTVYNYKDHVIGTTDGAAEVAELSFGEDGPLVVAEDFNGREYYLDEAHGDEAMYRYASYLRHPTAATWNDFMAYAPKDAIAFVIENPPVDVGYNLTRFEQVDDTSDMLYVVSLSDWSDIVLDSGDMDFSDTGEMKWRSKSLINSTKLKQGGYQGYGVIIPEGIPNKCIHVSAGDKGGIYPVSPVSGESDISSAFITATMSGEAALGDVNSTGDTYDPAESYSDELSAYDAILRKYRQAQNEKYTEDQLREMGLDTELIQHAWPWAASEDAVKFLIYDLNEDEIPELIITYYDYIIDIYGFDGERAIQSYSCMYRAQADLYEGGYLMELFSGTAADGTVTWYKYNPALADFIPVCKSSYLLNDSGKGVNKYYDYSPLGDEKEISEQVFRDMIPDENTGLTLPEGTLLAEFNGLN